MSILTRSDRMGLEKYFLSSKSSSMSLNSPVTFQNLTRSLELIGSKSELCCINASSVNGSEALWASLFSSLSDECELPLLSLLLLDVSCSFRSDESWFEADDANVADDDELTTDLAPTVRTSVGTPLFPKYCVLCSLPQSVLKPYWPKKPV